MTLSQFIHHAISLTQFRVGWPRSAVKSTIMPYVHVSIDRSIVKLTSLDLVLERVTFFFTGPAGRALMKSCMLERLPMGLIYYAAAAADDDSFGFNASAPRMRYARES